MSKYIIEIPDDVQYVLLNGKADHKYYTAVHPIAELEELNSDYINEHYGELQDTAYQKGLEEGKKQAKVQAHLDVCHDIERVAHGNYQKGLNDAWEAAKKIFGHEMDGGIPINEIGKAFGYAEDAIFCTADIIRHNTASEAIAKLKAYEEKQKEDIKVGDEVDWSGDRFIVTRIYQPLVDKRCNGIAKDGSVYMDVVCDRLTKTGRHFDIDKILEEMRK